MRKATTSEKYQRLQILSSKSGEIISAVIRCIWITHKSQNVFFPISILLKTFRNEESVIY